MAMAMAVGLGKNFNGFLYLMIFAYFGSA